MALKISETRIIHSPEPKDADACTKHLDEEYSRFARVYDLAVKLLPVWKTWIKSALPHIRGPRVLEASFGTGYLLMHYADEFETHGIDFNDKMVEVARANLGRKHIAKILAAHGFVFSEEEIGGFGSVQLYVAQKGT